MYAIYLHGKKKGTRMYEDAVVLANTEIKEKQRKEEFEVQMRKRCSACNHRYMQHNDAGECPTYL